MNVSKIQKPLFWTLVVSETTHVFCCVLPSLFSVLSLLVGLGIVTAMPAPVESLHHMLHDYELPMIALAGAILAFGWAVDLIAARLDCQTDGDCYHTPCSLKKRKAHFILKIATALFVFNLIIYFGFHAGH